MSDIADFRARQSAEEEAARAGLYGFSMTARHDFINARMGQGGQDLLDLIASGRGDEAMALWESGYLDKEWQA
jgi:hypothetical protein